MITIKSEREILKMQEAGRITALVLERMKEVIAPGVTTEFLNEFAEKIISENGGIPSFKGYNGFPSAICASINDELIHGIPSSKRALKEGDIISIDVGVIYQRYHGDAARSYPVGTVSQEASKLLKITEESLLEALKVVKEGATIGDVGYAVESYVKKFGYTVCKDFNGHGIGTHLHEDPPVPNYGFPNMGMKLKAGMCIAIEPMVMAGSNKIRTLANQWTVVSQDGRLNAHHENSLLVTKNGYKILTTTNKENN
jgi:methionyl aminopeptidase